MRRAMFGGLFALGMVVGCGGGLPGWGQQVPAAVTADAAVDKANPAGLVALQLPSHGSLLNAFVYVAGGAGPHPTVVLLHGFPGNERNLDLAQAMRRDGYDVMYFDYRGSWGSPGDFSLTHCLKDAEAALAYLRDPEHAKKLRADPKNIVLAGHSMGGFVARYVGAHDAAVRAVVLISAGHMQVDTVEAAAAEKRAGLVESIATYFRNLGMAPLAGCTPESLAKEVVANADGWNIPNLAMGLSGRPLLVVTSDDGLAASNDALTAAVLKAGGKQVTTVHIATDHSYSDRRIALEGVVLGFLEGVGR